VIGPPSAESVPNSVVKAVRDGCRPVWADGVFGWAWHCTCEDNRHGCDQQCSKIGGKRRRIK